MNAQPSGTVSAGAPTRSLAGKVALITGSGRGMGRAHAILLASRGADIVVHDILGDEVRETARLVAATGRRVHVCQADITSVAAIRSMIAEAEATLGPIDILVNNAGIGDYLKIEEVDEATFDRMFAVHVKGTFFCTQAVLPGMKSRRRGKIINIASIWGMAGADVSSHYCGAKAAILGLTKAWAKELAPYNIHVNAVSPGGVLTDMTLKAQPIEKIRAKEQKVPLQRWAKPEEIAATVAFLASSEADFITGQQISPNGGETIVGF